MFSISLMLLNWRFGYHIKITSKKDDEEVELKS